MRRLLALCFVLWALPVSAWTPPQGIPTPPLCAGPQPLPTPNLWVDYTNGNNANPGTQLLPKQTIPNTLTTGTRVQLVGTYGQSHSSPNRIEALGTQANPVWIMGGTVTAFWEISGSWLYIDEDINYAGISIRETMTGGNSGAICIQSTEFDGSFGGSGVFAQLPLSPAATIAYVVLINNYIHNLGDLDATGDPDDHCTSTFRPTMHHIWVLQNRLARCAGDGIQINGTNVAGGAAGMHHIYFGGNTCYQMRQTCAWAKESTDVVMSENLAQGGGYMRPSTSGPGACYGGQYNPMRVSILHNACLDAENGIILQGYSDPGVPYGGALLAGNLIFDVHCSSCAYSGATTNGGALRARGGGNTVVVLNNTVWDSDYGIQVGAGAGPVYYLNNIIGNLDQAEVLWEDAANITAGSGYSDYPAIPTYDAEGVITHPTLGQLTAEHSVVGDPKFYDVATHNYHLQPTSPALAAGLTLVNLNTTYQALHGTVPQINMLDMGALGSTTAPPPPPPPPDPPPPPPPITPISGAPCTCTEDE